MGVGRFSVDADFGDQLRCETRARDESETRPRDVTWAPRPRWRGHPFAVLGAGPARALFHLAFLLPGRRRKLRGSERLPQPRAKCPRYRIDVAHPVAKAVSFPLSCRARGAKSRLAGRLTRCYTGQVAANQNCDLRLWLANAGAARGHGEVSEWLKEHAWKACSRAIVTWVRIPPSPPRTMRYVAPPARTCRVQYSIDLRYNLQVDF